MKKSAHWLLALAVAFATNACDEGDPDDDDVIDPAAVAAAQQAGVPFPADNAPNAAKVELGRLLFWDPVLSGDRDVACATCHDPAKGYSDGLTRSVGTGGQRVARNALTVLDAAWNGWTSSNPRPDAALAPMFWDNRTQSLESQALGPLRAEAEMRGGGYSETTVLPEIVGRLAATPAYVARFEAAFGSPDVTAEAVARAIATFERTLVTVPSYERFLAGDDGALTAQQRRGLDEFRRSGCARCHSGPMLSDFDLHRFARGGEAIRTPSLRNVTRTAPYMHDGRAATLREVFDVYRRVDRRADDKLDDLRVPRGDDADDVIAFLEAASDGAFDASVPDAVPSGLPVGGSPR